MFKRKVQFKKALTMMVMVIMLVSMLAPASYAFEQMDANKPATLTVEFTGSSTKVEGMEFKAYQIATFTDSYGFEFTSTFKGYGISMAEDQAGYRAMAETLSGYIARDGIAPTATAVSDAAGKAPFGELPKGLYLVLADRYTWEANKMTYITSPTLVALPNSTDGNTWIYDVTISPKYTEIPPLPETPGKTDINVIKVWSGEESQSKRPTYIYAELICDGQVIDTVTLNSGNNWRHTWKDLDATRTYNVTEKEVPAGYTVTTVRDGSTFTINNNAGRTPPPTPPRTPRLPQTGQLWWPVPILAGLGFIFLVTGLVRRKLS